MSEVIASLDTSRVDVAGQLSTLTGLREYTSWVDLDWQSVVNQVSALRAEEGRIRSSSDELATLTIERDRVRSEITDLAEHVGQLEGRRGGAETEQRSAETHLAQVNRVLEDDSAVANARPEFETIEKFIATGIVGTPVDLNTIRDVQQGVADAVANQKNDAFTKQNTLGIRIVRKMAAFRTGYPQDTSELDDALASAAEYRALHDRVATDDLPRFEREFKEYLNQNTIRDIANLSAQLNKQEEIIRDRVETINESLHGIDYNEGRYIRLVPDRTPNTEIREFRDELRACTDNVMGGDAEQYSETRFLQVKRIVDRFKGREGTTEQDRNWTRRVTDVRQWFVFSVSERWRADDAEYENYTDSAGKSGGQKEKLAYTILAASLAYQFKLGWGNGRSKAFRFVVIDEAFGRGSDDSTRSPSDCSPGWAFSCLSSRRCRRFT